MLADQKLQPRRGRGVEVGDRTDLLFAGNADSHQNGEKHHEQHRRHGWSDRVDAFGRGVVTVADQDAGRRVGARHGAGFATSLFGKKIVRLLDIALDGRGARGVGAVDPGRYLPIRAALDQAAEIRRNLDGKRDVVRLQALFHFIEVADRRLLGEGSRTREIGEIGSALRRVVVIKRCVGEIGHVAGDAEAEDQQHDEGAEEGEGEPHRIAHQRQRLALGISEDAPQRHEGRAAGRQSLRILQGLDQGICRGGRR